MKDVIRNFCGGLLWLSVLFSLDAVDSYFLINRSFGRIQTDTNTKELLTNAILGYLVQMGLAYVLLGLMGGLLVHLLLRVWFRSSPSWLKWLGTTIVICTTITLMGYARQAITFPPLHDWFPWRTTWADFGEPEWIDLSATLVFLGLLGMAFRRWGRTDPGTFGRRVGALLLAVALMALVLHNPEPDKPVDNTGPNVVLIGIDALRPDHLSGHDYNRATSPNIDALLAESVVFDRAYTQLARTYPAWISMLSGTWPATHGIRDNLPTAERIVPPVPLLPQVLRDAGYSTTFVTDDSRFSYMVPETGFQHIHQPVVGMANFAVSVNEPRFRAYHGLMHNPLGFTLVPVQAYNQSFGKSYRPDLFAQRAVDTLAQASRADRFMYAVHSCVLHAPGDRVWPWNRMFGQRGYRGSNRFHYSRSGTQLLVEDPLNPGEQINKVAAQDVRLYDSGIAMADALVGRLVASLKQSGLWDNTIVVLFSDHGEEMWEPDLPYKWYGPNHGFHPYGEGQFRVLLGIRFPDGAHAGERVDAQVRLMDLAPTVTDQLGLDWPADIDARSLLPLVRGEDEPERLVYIETGLSEPRYWVTGHRRYPFRRVSERYDVDPETGFVHIRERFRTHLITAKDRVVMSDPFKLVWFGMARGLRVDLYDRRNDPANRHDLAEAHPEVVAELGAQLLPFLLGDGLAPPPPAEWIDASRAPKRLARQSSPTKTTIGLIPKRPVTPYNPKDAADASDTANQTAQPNTAKE